MTFVGGVHSVRIKQFFIAFDVFPIDFFEVIRDVDHFYLPGVTFGIVEDYAVQFSQKFVCRRSDTCVVKTVFLLHVIDDVLSDYPAPRVHRIVDGTD